MVSTFAALSTVLLSSCGSVAGHASFLLQQVHCPRQLGVGVAIMGQEAVLASGTISAEGYTSGDRYTPGDVVEVAVTGTGNADIILETSSGTFSTGTRGCGDTRVTAASATLTLPTAGSVTIIALWASQHGAVTVAESFVLSMSNADPCAPLDSDGVSCDDGVETTLNDICLAGSCAGTPDPCVGMVCGAASSACQLAGTCADGVCSAETAAPDGTSCNDGSAATINDVCTNGQCAGTESTSATDTPGPAAPVPTTATSSATLARCNIVWCLMYLVHTIGSRLT
eukprot:COSAG02_NODE_17636_length_990_cov_0.741863_1_plen_284_part_00